MPLTYREKQVRYRARRRPRGLCARPGCQNDADHHACCDPCHAAQMRRLHDARYAGRQLQSDPGPWVGREGSLRDVAEPTLASAPPPLARSPRWRVRPVAVRTAGPRPADAAARQSCWERRQVLYQRQGGLCAGCKTSLPGRALEVDHAVPRSRGGTDALENLQLLCSRCNQLKADRPQKYLVAELRRPRPLRCIAARSGPALRPRPTGTDQGLPGEPCSTIHADAQTHQSAPHHGGRRCPLPNAHLELAVGSPMPPTCG